MDAFKRYFDVILALKAGKKAFARQWTPEDLTSHQRERLHALISHASRNSPFYKELYQGIKLDDGLAITDLPVVNKSMMMDNYDRFVTDPRLKLTGLQDHIRQIKDDEYYLKEYRVQTTSGSTGQQGVFVFNRPEWSTAISTGVRTGSYAGMASPRFPRRWRYAAIGAGSPLHVTGRYYHCVDIGVHKMLRLTAMAPMEEMVTTLNRFQPDFIFAYSSLASLLAIEQLDGKLHIQPRAVTTNSEVRSEEMEQNIKAAWGITPFNTYGMTEAGLVMANDCARHKGMHIYGDLFIAESVDENNKPVSNGESGAKLLMTNLYNYTQPLIRYEITDVVTFSDQTCPCGSPFQMIANIGGRTDDILTMPHRDGGEVPVHPHNLRSPIAEITDIKQYQIIQEQDGLHINLVLRKDAPSAGEVRQAIQSKLERKLNALGAVCPALHINIVESIERDKQKMGKFRQIISKIPERN
jgi:phenylacetate-CoA ligase